MKISIITEFALKMIHSINNLKALINKRKASWRINFAAAVSFDIRNNDKY